MRINLKEMTLKFKNCKSSLIIFTKYVQETVLTDSENLDYVFGEKVTNNRKKNQITRMVAV